MKAVQQVKKWGWQINKQINKASHSPPTRGSLLSSQPPNSSHLGNQHHNFLFPLPEVLLLSITLLIYGIGDSIVSCPSWSSPNPLPTSRQSGKKRKPWLCASTTRQHLQHWCISSTVLVTNVWAAMKEDNSMPAKSSRVTQRVLYNLQA